MFKNRRPSYLVGKHIIPLNPYSPVARNYDYYETRGLMETVDKNIFRDGFMAKTGGIGNVFVYDDKSQTFITPEVKVVGRRGWADFRQIKPVAVIDVYDMMTHLSNVFGSINDFHFTGDNFTLIGNDAHVGGWWQPGAERDSSIQNNFNDDRFFFDMWRYRHELDSMSSKPIPTNSADYRKINSQRIWNKFHKHSDYNFDWSYLSYFNYNKILLLLGLDGATLRFVDSPVYGNQHSYVPQRYGLKENLPPGMDFFPPDVNFRKLYLYADTEDRSLIHQEGKYRERLYHYSYSNPQIYDQPLTSIVNFKTEDIYPSGFPEPDFYGFRINFQGFSVPDEFYCVDYSNEPLPMEGDYRRTIYWNPSVTTNENGHAQVTFYNNGFTNNIAVSAEGLTEKGFIIQEK